MSEPMPGEDKVRRILLVEDDRELRDALTEALEQQGHEVFAVGDGVEALRQMRRELPDVVILDLMMPVMDGWQFRVEQRRDPALASIPIVAMSASTSSTAAAVDADLYIRKPVDAHTLIRAVEDVLTVRERLQAPAKIAQDERMVALGTLAAGVAHEINNPLTYVLLHLTQVTRLLPSLAIGGNRATVEKLETLVQGALEGVERIRSITSGIRTFSRFEELAHTSVDVQNVLDAALTLLNGELVQRARLVRRYTPTPLVIANEGRLGQAFLSLLSNAIRAIPEGAPSAHLITVATGVDSVGRVFVDITDDGEGIPEHLRARIFDPFFSTRPVGEGAGLGLSIAQGVVGSLGGEISVASEVGQGATFRIALRTSHASGTVLKAVAAPEPAKKRRRRA